MLSQRSVGGKWQEEAGGNAEAPEHDDAGCHNFIKEMNASHSGKLNWVRRVDVARFRFRASTESRQKCAHQGP